MIKVNKSELCAGGCRFSLPDCFSIDPYPSVIYEDGINLYSPDNSYYLTLYANQYDEPVCTYISNFITENDCTIIEPVQSVIVNGMIGYFAIFCSERYAYYEVILEIPNSSEESNAFLVRFTIEGADAKAISELAHSETANSILHSIFPNQ